MHLKILQWFTRILAITSILFIMIFSFDVFTGDESPAKKVIGFVMHNIPTFILIVFLIIAWKREIAGGALFIMAFVVLAVFFSSFTVNRASLPVITPLLITGVAFIIHRILEVNSRNSKSPRG